MPLISVVTPCFNEEDNVRDVYEQVKAVFAGLEGFRYEHIFADNASTDRTVEILKGIALLDPNVKIIVNRRNFGPGRSGHHALLQTVGDAVIGVSADLQDPPALIPEFLRKWEEGYRVVLGVKTDSQESRSMFFVRSLYYWLIGKLADVPLVKQATGFGLYDRSFIEMVRQLDDPNLYTRGLVSEFGFEIATVPYHQPSRKRGVTKHNFLMLYDIAMTGITSHSKLPLRFATLAGFGLSALSLLVAVGYLVYKLAFWNSFPVGIAPVVIGLFLAMSIQLLFLGVLGEYIAVIHQRTMRRPLVVERERVNFDFDSNGGPRPDGEQARGRR